MVGVKIQHDITVRNFKCACFDMFIQETQAPTLTCLRLTKDSYYPAFFRMEISWILVLWRVGKYSKMCYLVEL